MRDGETYDSPLIGKYCGTSLPPPIMSSTRYLYAHFVSDANVAHNGFRLEYVTNGKLVIVTGSFMVSLVIELGSVYPKRRVCVCDCLGHIASN